MQASVLEGLLTGLVELVESEIPRGAPGQGNGLYASSLSDAAESGVLSAAAHGRHGAAGGAGYVLRGAVGSDECVADGEQERTEPSEEEASAVGVRGNEPNVDERSAGACERRGLARSSGGGGGRDVRAGAGFARERRSVRGRPVRRRHGA